MKPNFNPYRIRKYQAKDDWMELAHCRGENPNKMVPNLIDAIQYDNKRRQRFYEMHVYPMVNKHCSVCPVRDECLQYGLASHSIGIWGGRFLTRNSRKEKLLAKADADNEHG